MVTFAARAADTSIVWWMWLLVGSAVWLAIATLLGVLIGRGIRHADAVEAGAAPRFTAAVPAPGRVRSEPARRQVIPIPTFGLALFGLAVALESAGYIVRLAGVEASFRGLSMDAPFSLPRMYVAALFAAAALAAVAGAGMQPDRRAWWMAVGVIAGGIAAVKAGSTVHASALAALSDAIGEQAALLVSAAAVLIVIGALWFLSRHERRDRRRVLSGLAFYGAASVGLSALSSIVAGAAGGASSWAVSMVFLEEAGEALAGVACLLAVLAGVAPRLVLPGAWALRRAADAHTLQLPEGLPGRSTAQDSAAT